MTRKRQAIRLLRSCLLFFLLQALPQRVLADPPSTESVILDNGVRIILEVDKSRQTLSYSSAWRLDRSAPPKPGIGHLLQHVLEASPSARPLRDLLKKHKADILHEAFPDANILQIDLAKADLFSVLELDNARLKSLTLDEKILKSEQLRLIEEQTRNRNASLGIEENSVLASLAYLDPWYHQPADGLEKSSLSISAADLDAYFKAHYRAENLTLVLVGDFDKKLVLKKLREIWAAFPGYSAGTAASIEQYPSFQTTLMRREWPLFKKKRLSLTLGFPLPGWSDKDIAALEILSDWLTKGDNSLINKRLFRVQKIGLAARSEIAMGLRPQLFSLYFLGANDIDEGRALKEMRGLFSDIAQKGIPKAELAAVKARRIAEYKGFMRENPSFALICHDLFHSSYQSLYGRLESYAKVTALDIQRVLSRYILRQEPYIVVGVQKPDQR
jgi:zinc protease